MKMNKKTKKWLIFSGLKVLELLGLGIIAFFTWRNTLWIDSWQLCQKDFVSTCEPFLVWVMGFMFLLLEIMLTFGVICLVYIWIEKNIEVAEELSQSKRKR